MSGYILIILCFLYAVFNATGAALIKSEIPYHKLDSISGYVYLVFTWRVIAGFAFIVVSTLVIFKALSLGRFSYVLPISTGINFSLAVIIGIFFFGDRLNIYSWLGLLFILMGIVFMSLTKTIN